jgi:CBS domain containing-hemolysin-like protein
MSSLEMFVPLGAFAMIAISIGFICRLIATASLNRTIREALKSDPASVPILAQKLEARQPWADALLGWIFVAFAAAIVGLALFEDYYQQWQMLQAAVIPAVVGVTILAYCHLMQPRAAADAPPKVG